MERIKIFVLRWLKKLGTDFFTAYSMLLAAAMGAFIGVIVSYGSVAVFIFGEGLTLLKAWLLFAAVGLVLGALINQIRAKWAVVGIFVVLLMLFAPNVVSMMEPYRAETEARKRVALKQLMHQLNKDSSHNKEYRTH